MVIVYYIGLYLCGEYQVSHSKQIIKSIIAQRGQIWTYKKKGVCIKYENKLYLLFTWVDGDNTLGLMLMNLFIIDKFVVVNIESMNMHK